jgi:hypothetical protein
LLVDILSQMVMPCKLCIPQKCRMQFHWPFLCGKNSLSSGFQKKNSPFPF